MSRIKRFSPLVILLLAIVAVFALGLDDYVSFEQLGHNRARLLDSVDRHPFLAPFAFMLIYATAIALSIPGGAILTMAGGFLFGVAAGTLYAVIAATLGATVVFFISAFFYREDDPRSAECQRFDADLRTPVPIDPNQPVGGLNDYRMLSLVSILLGLVLVACVVLPSSPLAPPSINLIAGGLLFVIGALLWRASRPAKKVA